MADIKIHHEHGDRFLVRIRDHTFLVDQPIEAGGDDFGPTPVELFVTGLAACVGFYAERFLRRHNLATDGLAVDCDFEMIDDGPARVSEIRVNLVLPDDFPDARREALMRVVEHCTVHNSIRQAPDISIVFRAPDRVG